MYSSTTGKVTVSVEPTYLSGESAPEQNIYIWSYTVRIENKGSEALQLKNRYWKITDSYGRIHEIQGVGVIGEQPVLEPGESFEYTSGTPLSTPNGIMMGHYEMEKMLDGTQLDIDIPPFSLHMPNLEMTLH